MTTKYLKTKFWVGARTVLPEGVESLRQYARFFAAKRFSSEEVAQKSPDYLRHKAAVQWMAKKGMKARRAA